MASSSSNTPLVDIMNDPAYIPQKSSSDTGTEVEIYCRICRSEASPEEQLFHPCKCSGSIKFVHQDCLMEWLQHSQKKYCELCKTPFQFTKLYDPKMPKNLPPLLFISRASKHIAHTILLWLRFLLVCFVWLGMLPWFVRWMWRFWFWLGDGGWAWWKRRPYFIESVLTENATFPENISSIVLGNETTSPLEDTKGELTSGRLFANITGSTTLNKIFLDTLEGQILTALIVVTFVMIFLIREWVVQQQPGLALAGDAGGIENLADIPPIPEPAGEGEVDNEQEDEQDDSEDPGIDPHQLDAAFGRIRSGFNDEASDEEQPPAPVSASPSPRPRVYAPLRKRRAFPPAEEGDEITRPTGSGSAFSGQGIMLGGSGVTSSLQLNQNNPRRPQANREIIAQATEFRRQIEERLATPYMEQLVSSSATIPQMRSSTRNEIMDDDSDWEDEDEEGTNNTQNIHDRNANKPFFSSSFSPSPFESRSPVPESASKNILDLDRKPNSESLSWTHRPDQNQPRLFMGSSQPANSFGSWDSTAAPAFGKPFQFSGAESRLTQETETPVLFAQNRVTSPWQAGGVSESLWSTSDTGISDKGKGKEVDTQTTNSDQTGQFSSSKAVHTTPKVVTAVDDAGAGPSSISTSRKEAMEAVTGLTQVEKKVQWDWTGNRLIPDSEVESDGGVHDDFESEIKSSVPLHASQTTEVIAPNVESDVAAPEVVPPARDQARPQRNGWLDWFMADLPPVDREAVINDNRGQNNQAGRPQAAPEDVFANDDDNHNGNDWNGLNNPPAQVGGVVDIDENLNENGAEAAVAPVDIDEGDDFDGIMELIGMRGPIFGLIQNAVISIILISAAVMLGVAIPYIWGRILLTVLAHPILFTVVIPWSLAVFCANLIIDSGIYAACNIMFALDLGARLFLTALSSLWPRLSDLGNDKTFSNLMLIYANDGWKRVVAKLTTLANVVASDRTSLEGASMIATHSETSHAWLASRQPWARATLAMSWFTEKLAASVNLTSNVSQSLKIAATENTTASEIFYATLERLVEIWKEPSMKQRNVTFIVPVASEAEEALVEFSNSSSWTAADRVIAVIAGYVLFTIVGAWYLAKHKSQPGSYRRHLEKTSIELLQQAGGVMKVILIIGIEMFVFPLYCGLLLDIALLPLFEHATILSRIQFTVDHVFTSTFVHWFVGTCYMFHFALFVSMCRRIMRPGVLYFIRDPDDPTLHPVKDVLERPVMLQLRKIAFSALIYGFLVLVCLGGVVWFLYHQFDGVLPIHWSSNEPVLEFPVDLLFYNFFMPVAVQFFKPSEGLQKMYSWWFKKCAKVLRLTSFMFGDRHADEEGRAVRKTWLAALLFKGADPSKPVLDASSISAVEKDEEDTYFLRDGRFVRAPASDSVRRPKGQAVFIPVTEDNKRLDGQPDPEDGETGPNSTTFQMVYIPPHFKTRIFLVVLSIWLFAAVTGVGITIGPLLLGRTLLRTLVPKELRMNDVYAFSIGIYIIGAMLYVVTKYQALLNWFRETRASWNNPSEAQRAIRNNIMRAIKVSYVFIAFALVLPTLLALIIEFYIIIPMHTYFSQGETHVIHFIQDWTLGVLYVKMMGSMMLLDPESPWARALRGVVARGYLDPDVKLATRCFILPATIFMTTALTLPLGIAYAATKTFLQDASPTTISQAYRYSYPAVFVFIVLLGASYLLKTMMDKWKQSVRDEVYLIGERLHNHGERRPPTQTNSVGCQTESSQMEEAAGHDNVQQEPLIQL